MPHRPLARTLTLVAAAIVVVAIPLTARAEGNDTMKKIKESGTITVGARESSGALSFTLGDGKYVGFHLDVCQQVIADIQKQLGLKALDVKYQPVTSQNRVPLMKNGTIDLECGSTSNTAARQKDVAFAPALYVEEVRIATTVKSGISNISQLGGKTVATTTGTTSVQLLRKNKRAAGIDFKELTGKDHADSFLLLESGRADAFVMDGQILAGLISKAKTPTDFRIVGEPLSVEPVCIMYRRDDPAFKKAVDDSVRAIAKSGQAAKLYDKWFMQPIPPSNTKVGLPPSAVTKAAWASPTDKPQEDYAQP